MKHKEHSIRSYSKDISEAHEVFYKSMKGYLMLAWFLKEKQKHKGHKSCEQNKNRGIPIFVEEERWDANRGIPKLRCLVVLEYYLGVPWASPSLGACHPYSIVHQIFTQNLKTSQHKTQQEIS